MAVQGTTSIMAFMAFILGLGLLFGSRKVYILHSYLPDSFAKGSSQSLITPKGLFCAADERESCLIL